MTDEREDRLDALLRDTARDYNQPPATPKAELWARIAAARQRDRGTEGQRGSELRFRPRVRRPWPVLISVAAILALGVAIGRLTVPRHPAVPTPAPTASATPGAAPERSERGEMAAQLVTTQHFGQVETFLTEFATRRAARDLPAEAKDLLSTTRLLLDSKRLTDPGTRQLLEDLELVLIQIATLNPQDFSDELGFIADGLAQSHLRTRLRNAIPAAPAIRM